MRRGKSTGVSINPPNYKKRYRARIRIDGKNKDLGSFITEQKAKDAYLTALNNIIKNGKSNSISS